MHSPFLELRRTAFWAWVRTYLGYSQGSSYTTTLTVEYSYCGSGFPDRHCDFWLCPGLNLVFSSHSARQDPLLAACALLTEVGELTADATIQVFEEVVKSWFELVDDPLS